MVRLRNPMANLSDARPGAPRPTVEDDAALLARLNAGLRAHLRNAVAEIRGRALVVGAGWPDVALELAERGCFVTIVDARADPLARLHRTVIDRGLARHMTLDARSYGDVSFSAASFEAVIVHDPFPYLAQPRALIKKCRREMRAGGLLLIRVPLARGAPYPEAVPQRGLVAERLEIPDPGAGLGRVMALRDGVIRGVYRLLGGARLLRGAARKRQRAGEIGDPRRRGPAWEELREALEEELVVTRIDATGLLSFELAELACVLRPPLGTLPAWLLDLAIRLDERLLERPAARALATTVLVHATKERELGRVFSLPRR